MEQTGFQIGDIIKSYHDGIYRITAITPRNNSNPLITSEYVCSSDYEIKKCRVGAKSECDSSFCRKLNKEYYTSEKTRLEKQLATLKEFYEKHNLEM